MPLDVRGGWLTIGRWRGIPIRVHWSAPLGAVIWTGGEISLARILAFVVIIVVHELGHAILIRRARAHVDEITIHAMGGECSWHGDVRRTQRAIIAWGGVWAQLLLAIATLILRRWVALPWSLVDMFVGYNLYNAAFNLIPIVPLDGSKAWKLFPLLYARAIGRWRRRRIVDDELKQVLERAARRTRDL